MLLACLLAIMNAVVVQKIRLDHAFESLIGGFRMIMIANPAISQEDILPDASALLERGGMLSMMQTVLLVFCAFAFAGILSLIGSVELLLAGTINGIKTSFGLIGATIGATITVLMVTCDGKLSLLIPAEIFKSSYKKLSLSPKNLSRTIEDAGTVVEPLIP